MNQPDPDIELLNADRFARQLEQFVSSFLMRINRQTKERPLFEMSININYDGKPTILYRVTMNGYDSDKIQAGLFFDTLARVANHMEWRTATPRSVTLALAAPPTVDNAPVESE